ncbi:MAG: cell envelope integrity protein TolA [Pseudomonas sp.]|uniref:cell envelope integrity protein TolA n=1 Tax=Pseudomonas sp. TaxID=306 RepID=UPI0033990278
MRESSQRSTSESYFWPSVWAVGLHALIFALVFVSFAFAPDLPPSKPIVQATLYQLTSKSPATVQTNQKIAGEAVKTAARETQVEQLEAKKIEQQKQAAAEAKEKQEEAAQKAEEAKEEAAADAAEAKAAESKKAEEAKAEQQKLADIAKKKTEEERKKALEEAQKKAAEELKKKTDEAKKKADDAKKKADEARKKLEDANKKKAADLLKKQKAQEAARKSAEEKKAQALAELLSDTTERQAAVSDEVGEQVAGNFDDLIRLRAAESWSRPPSARKGMSVTVQVSMLPDGTITGASIARSSGDGPFDASAVAAVKNIGRITEMQGLSPQDFNPYRSFKMTFTPEDLAL